MSALGLVLERLERVRRQGGSWYARCPAHDDRSPSLKVDVGEDGRVLLSCKVGCRNEDIVNELGLEMRDLFEREDSFAPPRSNAKKLKQPLSESSPLQVETRQEIEEDWDSGTMSVEEYMHRLDCWNRRVPPRRPRVLVEFDEAGEITRYELGKPCEHSAVGICYHWECRDECQQGQWSGVRRAAELAAERKAKERG